MLNNNHRNNSDPGFPGWGIWYSIIWHVGTFTCMMYYHTQFIVLCSNSSSRISNKQC